MTVEEWKTIQNEYGAAHYAHLDYRVPLSDTWTYISDPEKISKHGFYPFIHYDIPKVKITNGHKSPDLKYRSIYYAAHLDRWIYKFYAYKLNEMYNVRLKKDNLSAVAVAYRTDSKKDNIHLAYEAFSFIRSTTHNYIIIGDFTDFFDNLNHAYLKTQLCNLLGHNQLPADYFAVYKNITKYSFFKLTDILKFNKLTNDLKGRQSLNQKSKVLSNIEFKDNKNKLIQNPNINKGIPQGSPISAVLANIYMLAIDKEINDYVQRNKGIYMRYSDDFIIVLPDNSKEDFRKWLCWITMKIHSVPDLTLQPNKTSIFHYDTNKLKNCTKQFIPDATNRKDEMNFLGFCFNGECVKLRDKTLSRYYMQMYRKAKTIAFHNGFNEDGKHISCKNLYEKYSYKGSLYYKKQKGIPYNIEEHGNFLDYIDRSKTVFKDDPVDQLRIRHMQKISKAKSPS